MENPSSSSSSPSSNCRILWYSLSLCPSLYGFSFCMDLNFDLFVFYRRWRSIWDQCEARFKKGQERIQLDTVPIGERRRRFRFFFFFFIVDAKRRERCDIVLYSAIRELSEDFPNVSFKFLYFWIEFNLETFCFVELGSFDALFSPKIWLLFQVDNTLCSFWQNELLLLLYVN